MAEDKKIGRSSLLGDEDPTPPTGTRTVQQARVYSKSEAEDQGSLTLELRGPILDTLELFRVQIAAIGQSVAIMQSELTAGFNIQDSKANAVLAALEKTYQHVDKLTRVVMQMEGKQRREFSRIAVALGVSPDPDDSSGSASPASVT